MMASGSMATKQVSHSLGVAAALVGSLMPRGQRSNWPAAIGFPFLRHETLVLQVCILYYVLLCFQNANLTSCFVAENLQGTRASAVMTA